MWPELVSPSVFARMAGGPRVPTVEAEPAGSLVTERSSYGVGHQHDRSHQALSGRPRPRGPEYRGPAGLDLRLPRRQRRGQDDSPQDPGRSQPADEWLGEVEVGASGEYGAQDRALDSRGVLWFLGGDLLYTSSSGGLWWKPVM